MNIKILSRQVLEQILEMPRVIQGVESVYKLKAKKGEAVAWPLVEHHFAGECRHRHPLRRCFRRGRHPRRQAFEQLPRQ